jgi:transcriptional regulator with XRE-family HTH domain
MDHTLGSFLARQLEALKLSNRALASGAGIAEGAVRNLLQHGINPRAKDPDPKTLRAVALYLGVDPLLLFRLAGYIPPARNAHSVYAEVIASIFDELPDEKKEAVLRVVEAMSETAAQRDLLDDLRPNVGRALEGFDLVNAHTPRDIANTILLRAGIQDIRALDEKGTIHPDLVVTSAGATWGELPDSARKRAIALAKAKLNLDYDATMADPKWRG